MILIPNAFFFLCCGIGEYILCSDEYLDQLLKGWDLKYCLHLKRWLDYE